MFLCFSESLEISNNVANGRELANVLVVDLNVKLLFAKHNEVSQLDRVDAEVVCQLGLGLDLVGIQLKLVNQNVLQSFKHNIPPKMNVMWCS